ncbi:unnamed protein product, partial [Prorocentrum cordatum]
RSGSRPRWPEADGWGGGPGRRLHGQRLWGGSGRPVLSRSPRVAVFPWIPATRAGRTAAAATPACEGDVCGIIEADGLELRELPAPAGGEAAAWRLSVLTVRAPRLPVVEDEDGDLVVQRSGRPAGAALPEPTAGLSAEGEPAEAQRRPSPLGGPRPGGAHRG